MKNIIPLLLITCALTYLSCHNNDQNPKQLSHVKMKALIIDGENNHGIWPKTTMMMKDYLESTGLFEVDIYRTTNTWQGPHYDQSIGLEDITDLLEMYPLEDGIQRTVVSEPVPDPNFSPEFSRYAVVISNMGWKASDWPEKTRNDFEKYMADGGGLVVVHAANNSWGNWEAYNDMIGVGGWGGRNTESGPYIYYSEEGKLHKDPSEGSCGSHGPQYEFVIETRAPDHPVMQGLPDKWLHTKDELYDRLRGPAENLTILATAYSDVEKNAPPWAENVKGTGRHEPMLIAINYGKGRVFHTSLGHMDYSMECVGFMVTFQRGTEWAASGNVTQEVPPDFPGVDQVSSRPWGEK